MSRPPGSPPVTKPGLAAAMALLDRLALRDWRHLSGMFFVSTLLESLALGHMTAFTPLFLRDDLKMAPEDVGVWTGLLAAATFAVAFPLAPLWGSLAERYSRKLIIVRSQYIEAVGYTLCGLAPDLGWFILARLLLGLTFGNIAIVIATQSLITPDRRVASAISIVQAATPIAISFGPPLGALLLPAIGLRGLFIADGIGCLVAGLLVTLLMPEPPGRDTKSRVLTNMKRSLSVVWRRPAVRMNFGAWYFGAGGLRVADSYLPVRIAELAPLDPAGAIGVILGAYGVVTTLATWATGRIVDRFGAAQLFWPFMVLATISILGTAVAPWLWLVAAFTILRAFPLALTPTVLYAHLTQVLERSQRAPVMSLTPLPRNFSYFSLPLLAAGAASFGTGAAIGVGALACGAAALIGRSLPSLTASAQPKEEGEGTESPPHKSVGSAPLGGQRH